jgi:hypothetical protein
MLVLMIEVELTEDRLPPSPRTRRLLLLHCEVPGAARQTLLIDRIDLLRKAIWHVRRSRPFSIDAWVVLPDHLHAVWTLPPGNDDFSTRWRLIKSFFARTCRNSPVKEWCAECSPLLFVFNLHSPPVRKHSAAQVVPPLYFEGVNARPNVLAYEVEGVRTRPHTVSILVGIALKLHIGRETRDAINRGLHKYQFITICPNGGRVLDIYANVCVAWDIYSGRHTRHIDKTSRSGRHMVSLEDAIVILLAGHVRFTTARGVISCASGGRPPESGNALPGVIAAQARAIIRKGRNLFGPSNIAYILLHGLRAHRNQPSTLACFWRFIALARTVYSCFFL